MGTDTSRPRGSARSTVLAACSLLARSWSPPPSRPVTHISTAPCRSHEGNHFTLSPLLLDTRHTTGRLPRCRGRQGQERALQDGTGVAKDVLGRTGPCYLHDCRSQHHGIRNAQTSNRRQERAGRGDRGPRHRAGHQQSHRGLGTRLRDTGLSHPESQVEEGGAQHVLSQRENQVAGGPKGRPPRGWWMSSRRETESGIDAACCKAHRPRTQQTYAPAQKQRETRGERERKREEKGRGQPTAPCRRRKARAGHLRGHQQSGRGGAPRPLTCGGAWP